MLNLRLKLTLIKQTWNIGPSTLSVKQYMLYCNSSGMGLMTKKYPLRTGFWVKPHGEFRRKYLPRDWFDIFCVNLSLKLTIPMRRNRKCANEELNFIIIQYDLFTVNSSWPVDDDTDAQSQLIIIQHNIIHNKQAKILHLQVATSIAVVGGDVRFPISDNARSWKLYREAPISPVIW